MRGLPPDDLLSRPALVYSAHVIEAISQYHGKNTESDQYRAQIVAANAGMQRFHASLM